VQLILLSDAIEFIQLKCGFSVLVLFGAPDPVLLYMHHPLVVLAAYPGVHISYMHNKLCYRAIIV